MTLDEKAHEATVAAIEDSATQWSVSTPMTTVFNWDYTHGREQLLRLYDKGTRRQWVASDRIDWSHELDFENPLGTPDEAVPIADSPIWERMSEVDKGEVRRHAVS